MIFYFQNKWEREKIEGPKLNNHMFDMSEQIENVNDNDDNGDDDLQ